MKYFILLFTLSQQDLVYILHSEHISIWTGHKCSIQTGLRNFRISPEVLK